MRSSAAFYIFEAKLKQKKVDCKVFCNEKMLSVTLFTTKNVKRHTFYSEKV